MNKNVSEKAGMIGLIVLILIMVGQYFCTFILAFSDIEYFDKKMRMKRKEISDLDECINLIIAGFFFSLNMLGYVSISCEDLSVDSRVIALLFTFLCIGLAAACKTLSLKDKLRQRTIEFLDYDKLQNDWTYEKEKTEDKLERYIRRMRQIEEQDNKRCLQYTDRMIRNMSEWEEKVEKIKGGDSKK